MLFWHKDGFSTACGHGTIALGVWAVRTSRGPVVVDVSFGGAIYAHLPAASVGLAGSMPASSGRSLSRGCRPPFPR